MQYFEQTTVGKWGSTSVTNKDGMDKHCLNHNAVQLARLKRVQKTSLVVVSSGSVAVGRALWRQKHGSRVQPSDRLLAQVGSGEAFTAWQKALSAQGLLAAQLLVTHREIDDPAEGKRMLEALHENLEEGIVTVVNENDALSDEELRKLSYGGDNDGLASHIARALGANRLILMTDRKGLLDEEENLVSRVDIDNQAWAQALAGEGRRGGMRSKVAAALEASQAGINTHIAQAIGSNLLAVAAGEEGTYFVPAGAA